MNTSSTTKQLAKCASKANATHPHLASVAHIDSYLYATDSYKLARVTVDEKPRKARLYITTERCSRPCLKAFLSRKPKRTSTKIIQTSKLSSNKNWTTPNFSAPSKSSTLSTS